MASLEQWVTDITVHGHGCIYVELQARHMQGHIDVAIIRAQSASFTRAAF